MNDELERYCEGLQSTLPEVSNKNQLNLLRLDDRAAYFRDSSGQDWYFDIDQRLWRPGQISDAHPMRLQADIPLASEKNKFDNIEDAAIHVMMASFKERVLLDTRTMSDYKPENRKEEQDLWVLSEIIDKYNEIIAILEQTERLPVNQRTQLRDQLTKLLKELDELHQHQD